MVNTDVLGVCLRPEVPWWVVYELSWARTHFVQREPWISCFAHEGCWVRV